MTAPADEPGRPAVVGPATAADASAEAERLLNQGEPMLAYGAVQEGRRRWPVDLRLRQLEGLALARSGDVEEANHVLAGLAADGLADAEALGMLARTHEDLALDADDERRAAHLEAAYRLYLQAYREALADGATDHATRTGIDAAAVAVLRDDLPAARRIAAEVRDLCRQRGTSAPDGARYRLEATLGETALILGDDARAELHYAAAAGIAAGNWGDLSTTRHRARLLAAHLPGTGGWIDEVMRTPPIVVYTGHMLDAAARPTPRFPPELVPAVESAMRERLATLRPLAAYGSAACGVDLLCLGILQSFGAETHVVLPFPPDEFRRVSVEFAGADWTERFDRALANADSVTITSEHRARDSTAPYEYANLVLTGMGRLRAQQLETSLHGVAAWDPAAGHEPGGTASAVLLWERRGMDVEHVHLPELGGAGAADARAARAGSRATVTISPPPPPQHAAIAKARHEIRSMLFADAVGFSQLSEDQIPSFVSGFLGTVADLIDATPHRPEHVETSGDGLYMVFETERDAARFALELSARIDRCDRVALGLPPTFNLRIGLHCGPVYCGRNPITRAPLYTGPHTSRTARIEPITPPGQVYASAAFAAVAVAHGADDLAMRYVGRIPLAKNYGMLPVYHVRPHA